MNVSVFLDVEDPIDPISDDAALDLAILLTRVGIRASFCVTGEKCRKLLARDRQDVIQALGAHCLGLHTNTHSYHPTTMELLANVSYEDGCHLALEAERPGYESFVSAFGRSPAFWGGAGNSWCPEIAYALRQLGIPAYSYSHTEAPGNAVHRFDGVIALPQHFAISEDAWVAGETGDAVLEQLAASPLTWSGVFVGHPSRFRHTNFWDAEFCFGHTPEDPQPQPLASDAAYETAKASLSRFIERLASRFRVVGVDEALSALGPFRAADEDELSHFRKHTAQNLRAGVGWPVHRKDLDPSNIIAKTLERSSTLEVLV